MPATKLRPYAGTPTWTFEGGTTVTAWATICCTHQSGAIGPGDEELNS